LKGARKNSKKYRAKNRRNGDDASTFVTPNITPCDFKNHLH